MTNNLNAVPILSTNSQCKVIVTGGTLRPSDAGLVGAQAAATVRRFKFNTAVIGCSAMDENGGIYDYDLDEVIASQAAIENSHATILVADHSKFERKAPARIAALTDITTFSTDLEPKLAQTTIE